MGSRKTYDGAEKVYEAAAEWVDRALRTDDSLFTPDKPIWTSEWLRELRERFLDRPDESSDSFLEKLQRQLEGSRPEVYQLMGEALYFYFLIVYAKDSSNEQRVIDTVLGWSPTPVAIPPDLVASLSPGIANPGMAFHTYRPFQVGFLIEFVEQFKDLQSSERGHVLRDPWTFKDFLMGMRCHSQLLRDNQNTPRIQRQALLHLVHPDTFEGTVSVDHKRDIAGAKAFAHFITDQAADVDRRIQQVRQGLETGLERDFDFYDQNVLSRWDPSQSEAWDGYIGLASKFLNEGLPEITGPDFIARDEIDYKLEIARDLSAARDAVLSHASDWQDLLRQALRSRPGHPIAWQLLSDFNRWCGEDSDEVLEALRALWGKRDPEEFEPSARISDFADILPDSALRGATGNRTNVISVLLMGLDVERYPPFRVGKFDQAYELTGYDSRRPEADEAELYVRALGFLDRFIAEARARAVPVRHRLDAQSLVWMIPSLTHEPRDDETDRSDDQPPDDDDTSRHEPDLPTLAKEVFLPVHFLEEIDTLLKDKKQVIFQGPPGTGKTYVAQKLAKCLAGSRETGHACAVPPVVRVRGLRAGLSSGAERATDRPDSSCGTDRCCGPRSAQDNEPECGPLPRHRRDQPGQPRQGVRGTLLPAGVPRRGDEPPIPAGRDWQVLATQEPIHQSEQ